MAQINCIQAGLAECKRLLDASTDPLAQDVYRAMLDEFGEKLAAARSQVEATPIWFDDQRRRHGTALRADAGCELRIVQQNLTVGFEWATDRESVMNLSVAVP